jgi:mevalonate kinase
MTVVSAPGKIFLMGEHAVVYGYPALLSAINMRLRVAISEGKGKTITIDSPESPEHVLHAIETTARHYQIKNLPSMHVAISSDIPAGYHVGSSAAVAVATVAAVSYFLKKIWNPMEANRIAYEVEKSKHGNPSGADNTAVTVGGLVWYRKELEFLRSIWQLPFSIHAGMDHFFLIDTGRSKETTGEMVALVGKNVKKRKAEMDTLFLENERQTRRIAMALKEGNEKELIDAMKIGEKTLERIGVVGSLVTPVIREIEKSGGAAKILGGGGVKGGVGYLLSYYSDKHRLAEICKRSLYTVADVRLGEGGVRLDEK